LKAGTVADLFVFSLEEGEFPLEDTHMKIETASRRIKPRFTLKAGEITEAEHIPNLLRKLRGPDYDVFKFLHETA
jgi:predicted amidohydrolase